MLSEGLNDFFKKIAHRGGPLLFLPETRFSEHNLSIVEAKERTEANLFYLRRFPVPQPTATPLYRESCQSPPKHVFKSWCHFARNAAVEARPNSAFEKSLELTRL